MVKFGVQKGSNKKAYSDPEKIAIVERWEKFLGGEAAAYGDIKEFLSYEHDGLSKRTFYSIRQRTLASF